jgi:primosomal protein N' (replication factor Y)
VRAPHRPFLLEGVTGSGQDRRSISRRWRRRSRRGGQRSCLLPEIALTEPFLEALRRPIRVPAGRLAFELSQSQRRRAWRAIARRGAGGRSGARSALFLPYRQLGLIVVDEAHETSFKQEDGVHYPRPATWRDARPS